MEAKTLLEQFCLAAFEEEVTNIKIEKSAEDFLSKELVAQINCPSRFNDILSVETNEASPGLAQEANHKSKNIDLFELLNKMPGWRCSKCKNFNYQS